MDLPAHTNQMASANGSTTPSPIYLFRKLRKSVARQRENLNGGVKRENPSSSPSNHGYHGHSLLVRVDNIAWDIVTGCEVTFFLVDRRKDVQLTESVSFNFKEGVKSSSSLPLQILFSDVGKSEDNMRSQAHVFLVAHVVREIEFKGAGPDSRIRKPVGVAAMEVTEALGTSMPVYFMQCGPGDTMDSTFFRLTTSLTSAPSIMSSNDIRIVALVIHVTLVSGSRKQICQDHSLAGDNFKIAPKIGLPDVIVPSDIHNDLCTNMVCGSFLHSKPNALNRNSIEVTVSVRNGQGEILPNAISDRSGSFRNEYKSLVYHHESAPRWSEHFKIALPLTIQEFSQTHVLFTFKHRSSTGFKARPEQPFAFAYLRLKESQGTVLKDGYHDLLVYKIKDSRHFFETLPAYLTVPSKRVAYQQGTSSKLSCPDDFLCAPKDTFFIKTQLCSTKFTQDAHVLGLLQWVTKLKSIAEANTHTSHRSSVAERNDHSQLLASLLIASLKQILEKVQKVPGEEFMKCLTDILDALFAILADPLDLVLSELEDTFSPEIIEALPESGYENFDSEVCDGNVVDCLVHIFGLLLDHKYKHFQSVLSVYLDKGFSSTLAYRKILKALEKSISEPTSPHKLVRIMNTFGFFSRLIVKSFENHQRFLQLQECESEESIPEEHSERTDIRQLIESLFVAIVNLFERPRGALDADDLYVLTKCTCLRKILKVAKDFTKIYPIALLTEHLRDLLNAIPEGKMVKEKHDFLTALVQSDFFLDPESRLILLPVFVQNIGRNLPGSEEELLRSTAERRTQRKLKKILGATYFSSTCNVRSSNDTDSALRFSVAENYTELLCDMWENLLQSMNFTARKHHLCNITEKLLRTIILSIGVSCNDKLVGSLISILLSFLQEINSYEMEIWTILANSIKLKQEQEAPQESLICIMQGLLDTLTSLCGKNYFPYFSQQWHEFMAKQNSIIIKTLENLGQILRVEFTLTFHEQLWSNYFHCIVAFLSQAPSRLHNFPQDSINSSTATDLDVDWRTRAATLIWDMWSNLRESHRVHLLDGMVEPFVNMSFIPQPEVRETSFRILYDMMRCEYRQLLIHQTFQQVESALILKIVQGFEDGRGDENYQTIFEEIMTDLCQNDHDGLREPGLKMVADLTSLIRWLFQYRQSQFDEDSDNKMRCIAQLIVSQNSTEASKEISRQDLYLRYVYKLYDLHILEGNKTEAAFALKLHNDLLTWPRDAIPLTLENRYPDFSAQWDLKEALCYQIIGLFSEAKMFELALEICQDLHNQYKKTYEYSRTPNLMDQMRILYESIINEVRSEPTYFRVAFYGRKFPEFLQNKVYVYRGALCERLEEFKGRMKMKYPDSELLDMQASPENVGDSENKYLQICTIEPVITDKNKIRETQCAADNIRSYYKWNEVSTFSYSRPFQKGEKIPGNEFATLWAEKTTLCTSQSFPGILRCFPVMTPSVTKIQIPPLLVACETLEKVNDQLHNMALHHWRNPRSTNFTQISIKLSGVLEASVMGGLANYESAFFGPEYVQNHPGDMESIEKLKRLIMIQTPILEECLKIHARNDELKDLHEHLMSRFKERTKKNYNIDQNEANAVARMLRCEMDWIFKREQPIRQLGMSEVDATSSINSVDAMRNLAQSTFSLRTQAGQQQSPTCSTRSSIVSGSSQDTRR